MLGGRVLAELPKGSKLLVTSVKGDWVGGHVELEGTTLAGWVAVREVSLLGAWPPWKRILGEGRVFTPGDLVSLTTAFSAAAFFGRIHVSENLTTGLAVCEKSRLSMADLVAAYGEPDARREDPKSADRWVLTYGPIELYVSKDKKKVYSDSLSMPNVLWVALHKHMHGHYPPKLRVVDVEDLTLPPPLEEQKAAAPGKPR